MNIPTHQEPVEVRLKPCPHCASADIEVRISITDAYVACNNCGARTGLVYLGSSDPSNAYRIRKVITAWNTRTKAQTLPMSEGLAFEIEHILYTFASNGTRVEDRAASVRFVADNGDFIAKAILQALRAQPNDSTSSPVERASQIDEVVTALLALHRKMQEAVQRKRPYPVSIALGDDDPWTILKGALELERAKASLAALSSQPVEAEGWRKALERIADPRNIHFAGDAQVVARDALSTTQAGSEASK